MAAVFCTQRVQDYGIFTKLGVIQDYEFGLDFMSQILRFAQDDRKC